MTTENLETNPYGTQSRAPRSSYYEDGLGTKQTVLVLIIVVGCFAVLWPNLLYPLLFSATNKPGPRDSGCCDVISELDVDTIKIMSELCSTIIDDSGQTPLTPKEIVSQCKKAVLETCGIDISAALQDGISLGQSAKQILEEVRSLNGSLCLKYNFGVSPWKLGVPHRVNINLDPANTIRQERPPHMHPGMVHPAFKERGRAIPETDDSTDRKRSKPPPRIVEGRPGPIPGMRAAMAGHQVAAPKQSSYGFMGVVMPMYTIGFVIFFSYTIMKLLITKKPADDYVGSPLYPPCDTDEQFHKEVFEANKHYFNRPNKDTSKIGHKERDTRDEELDQLRKRLRETELAMERIVSELAKGPLIATKDEIRANGSLPKEEEQGSVTVMGMETTASSESGKKWSRPDSPVLPHPQPAPPKEPSPPPQQIFLEGALPPQSQILVADSATEAQKDPEDDSPVVLAGKMTLSVISVDSEPGTEDSSNSGKKTDEDRRRSSSNISEEFEKINAADLEDQINHIIEEAEQIALAEENRLNLDEELDKLPEDLPNELLDNDVAAEENRCSLREELEEIPQAPNINEKESNHDILEEIKNQFNLEDDLIRVLREEEPEGKVSMPVTDIIKEFLNNEENILHTEDLAVETVQSSDSDNQEHGVVDEPINEDKRPEDIASETKNIDESAEELSKEKLENLISPETSKEERLEPLITEEQIVSPQKKIDEERLSTTELSKSLEQFLKSETDGVLAKEQELGVNEEGLLITEPLESDQIKLEASCDVILPKEEEKYLQELEESTQQFLRSEASSGVVLPKKEEKDLEESTEQFLKSETSSVVLLKEEEKDLQELEEFTEQFLKSEASTTDFAQPTEQKGVGLIENQEVLEKGSFTTKEAAEQFMKSEASSDTVQPKELSEKQDVDELTTRPIETNVNTEETPHREAKPDEDKAEPEEKPPTNKADLLLQGLMVKDAVENSEEGLLEASTSTKRSTPETDQRDEADEEEILDVLDVEEQEIEDIEYQDDDEDDLGEDELRGGGRSDYEDRESAERRVNGEEGDFSRNGAGNSETAAENEISEDDLENEDDEEIEEIIEYVDNTDEEGEEVIEINGNEHRHLNENGTH